MKEYLEIGKEIERKRETEASKEETGNGERKESRRENTENKERFESREVDKCNYAKERELKGKKRNEENEENKKRKKE